MTNGMKIDFFRLSRTIDELKGKPMRQVFIRSLRESAKILVAETNKQLGVVVDTKPHPIHHTAKWTRSRVHTVVDFGTRHDTGERVRVKAGKISSSDLYWWKGKGIKAASKAGRIRITATGQSLNVHIMNDFRLKWFEMGTASRHTEGNISGIRISMAGRGAIRNAKRRIAKGLRPRYFREGHTGKGRFTGRIRPTRFFTKAQAATRRKIFSEMESRVSNEIGKIAKKYGVLAMKG